MTAEQEELPLGEEKTIPNEEVRLTLPAVEKALDRARRTVNVLVKAQDTSPSARISDLGKAIAALQEIELARVLSDLNRQHAALVETRDNALKLRRENLARSASEAGWPVKRLKEYDFAVGFQVSYRLEEGKFVLG